MSTAQILAGKLPDSIGRAANKKDQYVLFLGSARKVAELAERSSYSKTSSCHFLGYFTINGSGKGGSCDGVPFLGSAETLKDYISQNPVDMVVPLEPLSPSLSSDLLEPALEIGLTVAVPAGIPIKLRSGVLERAFVSSGPLLGSRGTFLSTVRRRKGYLLLKRVLDILLSTILLIALAPLLIVIAVVIKLSSPKGPVLHPMAWLGKNGRPFVGYKFRTMVPNAEQMKEKLLRFNEMEGPVFKMRNDPRITPFGRILRKFSLDELPQLYSVLRGDMSLVGPRPPGPHEAERFAFLHRRKLSVKPGITCLWQISGRNEIRSFDEWVRLDLKYIENASLLLDLKILFRTILVVLEGQGAY